MAELISVQRKYKATAIMTAQAMPMYTMVRCSRSNCLIENSVFGSRSQISALIVSNHWLRKLPKGYDRPAVSVASRTLSIGAHALSLTNIRNLLDEIDHRRSHAPRLNLIIGADKLDGARSAEQIARFIHLASGANGAAGIFRKV